MRDGTAESVSRDQILRRERGQGNIHFPCSAYHEQDWQNLNRLIHTLLYVMTIHTITVYPFHCCVKSVPMRCTRDETAEPVSRDQIIKLTASGLATLPG